MNLADFHEASRGRIAVPLAVGNFKTPISLDITSHFAGAAVSSTDLSSILVRSHEAWGSSSSRIDIVAWNESRYFPVPTIIEAATAVYKNHDVKEIARSRAGLGNLEITQKVIVAAVHDAIRRSSKKLIMVTGVPGAGKTLAGLNAVQLLIQELDLNKEQASFLSGNGPLVKVIQEALKRSVGSRKKGVARSVRSRVREIHSFVKDSYAAAQPPVDRLIVFDEAQRAWTAAKNLKKFGRDVSEPEMILEIMSRHDGWAVVVALIGGGQEIHGGEAGLAAWGDGVEKRTEWEVVTSPEAVHGGQSVAGSRLFRSHTGVPANTSVDSALHLSVSRRSFVSEVTSAWVNLVLDGKPDEARALAMSNLPIYITRDLRAARKWLQLRTKGFRRSGLIASSGAARLRAEGVETPTFSFLGGIDYVKWFLEPAGDHRSSIQLEVSMSEFEMQGLELDLTGLLWGGDLIFSDRQVIARTLRGKKWLEVSGTGDSSASADDAQTRIKNKYRVLLTRFRQAMVIFVPEGSQSDQTRCASEFDGVHNYLVRCGVRTLPA